MKKFLQAFRRIFQRRKKKENIYSKFISKLFGDEKLRNLHIKNPSIPMAPKMMSNDQLNSVIEKGEILTDDIEMVVAEMIHEHMGDMLVKKITPYEAFSLGVNLLPSAIERLKTEKRVRINEMSRKVE